ncbi:MAG: glucose-6-phosphate dehydrogenase assembly protein OpcA [Bryobacteraceae bacterium]
MSAVINAVLPEKILKDLSQLWTSLGEDEKKQGQPTVLRACAMTLIVVTDDEDEDSLAASQTLIDLMHTHPSRAIVIRVAGAPESGITAQVLAQCWKPFGKAQQICSEQIEIQATPDRWPDVRPIILGIMVPDLPVVVWCRQKSALRRDGKATQHDGLESLFALATKVIVDTRSPNPPEAIEALRSWKNGSRVVADLQWTRLTPWREAISGAFDDPQLLAQRNSFQTIEIVHSEPSPPSSALYLAGWLRQSLSASVSFVQRTGFGTGLQRVAILGPSVNIELERVGPTCAELRAGSLRQTFALTTFSLYTAMNEELNILGPDEQFRSAFAQAQAFLPGASR